MPASGIRFVCWKVSNRRKWYKPVQLSWTVSLFPSIEYYSKCQPVSLSPTFPICAILIRIKRKRRRSSREQIPQPVSWSCTRLRFHALNCNGYQACWGGRNDRNSLLTPHSGTHHLLVSRQRHTTIEVGISKKYQHKEVFWISLNRSIYEASANRPRKQITAG